jgi:hypothetical protein
MTTENRFAELAAINVNDRVEKKGNLPYLSWAWAVEQLLRRDPTATWAYSPPIHFGDTMLVFCTVTAFGKAMTMQLPVMDNRNKAIANPDAFAVNTAMQRCLVKAIALHGLGLYIYAGEDLPPSEDGALGEGGYTPTQEAALEKLRAAALLGIDPLQVAWKAQPEDMRAALKGELASLKAAASKVPEGLPRAA